MLPVHTRNDSQLLLWPDVFDSSPLQKIMRSHLRKCTIMLALKKGIVRLVQIFPLFGMTLITILIQTLAHSCLLCEDINFINDHDANQPAPYPPASFSLQEKLYYRCIIILSNRHLLYMSVNTDQRLEQS